MADHNEPCGCDESRRLREQVRLLQDKSKLDAMALQGEFADLESLKSRLAYYKKKYEEEQEKALGTRHAFKDSREEFAKWLDGMIRQGLAKQTKLAELNEMFMPCYLLSEYEMLLRKEGRTE